MKKSGKTKRLVVAVVSADTVSGRAELRGVTDAARRFGWRIETIDNYFLGENWFSQNRELLLKADGIIARHYGTIENGCLVSLGIPLVGLDIGAGSRENEPLVKTALKGLRATVACDASAVAVAAANELIATGRRNFVVVPPPKHLIWTREREKAFMECIRNAGCSVRRYSPITYWDWTAEREALSRWIARQPRPFGIFAANDHIAKFALEACLEAGLEVPRDAVVIGADDDDNYCLSVKPNLTSVRIDFEGAGRLAAQTLERMMDGRDEARPSRRPSRPLRLLYGVLGVARRGSTRTGIAPSEDPRLQDGLDYIARRFGDPYMGIRDVARAMDVCPRQAERIFATTGKSIRRHVEDARLGRVKELLATSDMPIGDIARECGFASPTYFCDFCRRTLGSSPSVWRAKNRG